MATDKLVDFDHVTDYISREAAEQVICEACERPGCPALWGDVCDSIDRLNTIPAADVVEVVLCKDCRHRDPEDNKCDCGQLERAGCVFPVRDDYFCAHGEKGANE